MGSDLRQRLAQFPRIHYSGLPTPLEQLPRLSETLNGPTFWIKRDDGFGPGMGGNKGRKLSFLMAEVLQQGKQKVVTYGGLQSNHARMTAAACAALGLEPHLFFFEKRPLSLEGNLFLDTLFGARLHFIPFGGGGNAAMTLETTNKLVRILSALLVGPRSYFMPVGGHTVTGCLGYAEAAWEIHDQVIEMGLPLEKVVVITAVGTGGTLAGLMAGFHLIQSPIRLLGLDIGKLWQAFPKSIARLASDLCAVWHQPAPFFANKVPMIEAIYAGEGYSVLNIKTITAMHLLAEKEGVVLDPVYTGKAFAGLLDLTSQGRFQSDEHVVFLHTGGFPGNWAYSSQIAAG
jgi:1-aminocyclopropane-1-carboxylate deaminase/D-cysteine desulfhydrase-like pyridoxal-dependent ACC family enzyme